MVTGEERICMFINKKLSISCGAISIVLLAFAISWSSDSDLLTRMSDAIKKGPLVYYSPEAVQAFSQSGQPVSGTADRETALTSLKAHITLGELGGASSGAVPLLVETFCKAVHVSTIQGAQYSGEGTFDDWVSTYIMSEKNKFLLSSPFLDYNSMSFCEQYIDAVPNPIILEKTAGANGAIRKATADIQIILTFHVGACALSKITGMDFGKDPAPWRQWWDLNKNSFSGGRVTSTGGTGAGESGSFSSLLVGGKYRMVLTTGDELVGYVESKTDTSIIFETVDKKPYSFKKALVVTSELLAPPKKEISKEKAVTLTFEELQNVTLKGVNLEVKLKNGTFFRGSVNGVEPEMLKLNVDGSQIPISRAVIERITTIPEGQMVAKPEKEPFKMTGPFDTVFVKNPQTDDYGRPFPDLVMYGKIAKSETDMLHFTMYDGSEKKINRGDVKKIVKHSDNKFEEPIKKYAMPLTCPPDMILVDLAPGAPDRPFFKVCIDKYEYPNKMGVMPTGNISYEDAKKMCESQGKRLCTADEWKWACSGKEDLPFPYGTTLDKSKCNSEGTRKPETSGLRHNCSSKYGVFDMVGNIFEWVETPEGDPSLMGGPLSKCATITPGGGGSAKPQTGVRCCRGN